MEGFPIIAMATESFRLFPPERVPESLCSYYTKLSYLILFVIKTSLFVDFSDFKS